MKKSVSLIIACMLMMTMLCNVAFAANNEHQITLEGKIHTGILAVVVVPTSTTFVYDFEQIGWNKIISSDISVTNNGVSALNLDLIDVTLNSPDDDINLVQIEPSDENRDLRIAFAPDGTYSGIDELSAYFLDTAITADDPISLTDEDGISGDGAKGTYRLYGDISDQDNWTNEETFTLSSTLKVSVIVEVEGD